MEHFSINTNANSNEFYYLANKIDYNNIKIKELEISIQNLIDENKNIVDEINSKKFSVHDVVFRIIRDYEMEIDFKTGKVCEIAINKFNIGEFEIEMDKKFKFNNYTQFNLKHGETKKKYYLISNDIMKTIYFYPDNFNNSFLDKYKNFDPDELEFNPELTKIINELNEFDNSDLSKPFKYEIYSIADNNFSFGIYQIHSKKNWIKPPITPCEYTFI